MGHRACLVGVVASLACAAVPGRSAAQGATGARAPVGQVEVVVGGERRVMDACATADHLVYTGVARELRGAVVFAHLETGQERVVPGVVPGGQPRLLGCGEGEAFVGDSRSGEVMALTPDGGRRTVARVEGSPLYLVAADADLFFTSEQGRQVVLFRVPRSGGSPVRLAGGRGIGPLAVDRGHVYFADYYAGTVDRVPVGGGRVEVLARGQTHPIGVAVWEGTLYWTLEDSAAVVRRPLSGGRIERIDAAADNADSLTVHDGFLYWRSWGGSHGIERLDLGTGRVERILDGLREPLDPVPHSSGVYVPNRLEGTLLRWRP